MNILRKVFKIKESASRFKQLCEVMNDDVPYDERDHPWDEALYAPDELQDDAVAGLIGIGFKYVPAPGWGTSGHEALYHPDHWEIKRSTDPVSGFDIHYGLSGYALRAKTPQAKSWLDWAEENDVFPAAMSYTRKKRTFKKLGSAKR